MANEFTPLLRRQIHKVHEILPTPTILRKYKILVWTSTMILVRHAEKAAGGDPPLSAAGQTRANLLCHMLQDENLSAVFVSNTQRSEQTGQPTATGQGLALTQYNATDGTALAATIRANHSRKTVLVVAHSNTVDDIAGALGASGVSELPESQYDRMFVITRSWCTTRLTRLRYGVSTP